MRAQSTGAGTLAGVVRDTLGNVLRDAEISIAELGHRATTDSTGSFVVPDVAPGSHDVWIRRIGFIIVQFRWTAKANERVETAITMRPLPHTLDPVVVFANESREMRSKSVVRGTVLDSAGFPVQGAEVQLIGTGRATVTSDDGAFVFRRARPGDLTIRVRMIGYSPAATRITLGENDEREVFLRMGNLAQQLEAVEVREQSGFGQTAQAWREYDQRSRWLAVGTARFFNAEKLKSLGYIPLDLLVRGEFKGHGGRVGGPVIRGDGCVLINGLQAQSRPLSSYDLREVDAIEYYPPAGPRVGPEREVTGTVERRIGVVKGCEKKIDGSHPAWYVLWLKDAK